MGVYSVSGSGGIVNPWSLRLEWFDPLTPTKLKVKDMYIDRIIQEAANRVLYSWVHPLI